MTSNPLVFISYAQFDDSYDDGALTRFRDELSHTLRFISGNEVAIFQENDDVEIGQPIQERINQSLKETMVFVPVLTPNFFKDVTCRNILEHFLGRESQLGRNDLVLAVYYQQVPNLDNPQESNDVLVHSIAQRRMLDWRTLRGKDFDDPQVRQELERLAKRIIDILKELQDGISSELPASSQSHDTTVIPQEQSKFQETHLPKQRHIPPEQHDKERVSDQQRVPEPPAQLPPTTTSPQLSIVAEPKSEPQILTLRFTSTPDRTIITWESIAGGTRTSLCVMPYTSINLSLVIKALDAAQYPGHPHEGPHFDAEEQTRLQALNLWQHGRVLPDAHRVVGHQLYRALTNDRDGELALRITREAARSQGQSLTYILRFPPDAVELAALPWEALWDTRQAVLLSRGVRQIDSMERYLELDEALSPPLPTDKTLHILVLSPQAGIPQKVRDEEHAARLRSWDTLKTQGLLDWDELSPVTAQALDDRLRRGPTPDIIHYYGHGRYHQGHGDLMFDSSTTPGQHEWMDAHRLAALMGGIRLIVIHACQSAMVPNTYYQSGVLTGLAPALSAVSEAVVAMQLTVRISAATRFSEVFYAELARGRSLQAAVAEARRSLYVIESDGASWYVPMLYIRTRKQEPLYFVQTEASSAEDKQKSGSRKPVLSRNPRSWTPWLRDHLRWIGTVFSVISVVALFLGFYNDIRDIFPARLQPMDLGGWNIAVAGIGVVDEATETVSEGEDGEILSNQIEGILAEQASDTRKWDDPGVGFVTGNLEVRLARAKQIAEDLNASVVVYGTTQPSGRRAVFVPELYVREPDQDYQTFVYGAEILGAEQFGKPVSYVRNIQGGDDNVNSIIATRIAALDLFLQGLQQYYADDFDGARAAFCQAIPQAELVNEHCLTSNEASADDDTSHTAVVHLYLGAVEFLEDNPDGALRHATTAQIIWPEYPRPLITKGAIFFTLANQQYAQVLAETYSSPPEAAPLANDQTCAAVDTLLNLTIEDNLELARRCYEEALALNANSDTTLVSTMDIEPKAMLSLGNIAFLLADLGQAEWQQAREKYQRVLDIYTSPDISPSQQERLHRLVAHAYARQGLIIVCEPDCNNPTPKSTQDYEAARTYYEQALDLLQDMQNCIPESTARVNDCADQDSNSISAYQKQLEGIQEVLERRSQEQRGSIFTLRPQGM